MFTVYSVHSYFYKYEVFKTNLILQREIYQLTYITLLILITYFFFLPINLLNGFSFASDANTRVEVNDALVSTYYFWWTNLTYLPLFFFLLPSLPFTLFLQPCRTFLLGLLYILILLVYSTELLDFISLNLSWDITTYGQSGLNSLLMNTLNRYHPFIFYSSFILVVIAAMHQLQSVHLRTTFIFFLNVNPYGRLLWVTLVLNLCALWMGSWWALQEGTWGGWWNWDSSEVFGLLISLAAVWLTHSTTNYSESILNMLKNQTIITGIVFIYFFIQLNFELVSHNFGSKFFFFFNNNLFFLEVILMTSLIIAFLLKRYTALLRIQYIRASSTSHLEFISAYISRLSISLSIVTWIIFSFKPLISYFIWNFISANVFNTVGTLYYPNFLIALLLLWVVGVFKYFPLFFVFTPFVDNWIWAWVLLLTFCFRISVLHNSLLLFAVVNWTVADFVITTWVSTYANDGLLDYYNTFFLWDTLYTANANTWDASQIIGTYNYQIDHAWNLYALTNAPVLNFFILDASVSTLFNIYVLDDLYSYTYLHFEIPLLTLINILFWCVILLLFSPLRK